MGTRIQKVSKYTPSIFQGKLDFAGTTGVSLSIEHPAESTIIRVLFITLVVLICAYLYFISASVLNVIARKESLAHISRIQGSIGSMEQKYFALSQDTTPEAGLALGLAPVGVTHYVYRPGNVGAATAVNIASNEI